ncbi:hydrogenase maturation protease [Candidatus Hecatella orcuttiae]|uniref:hydrogenase maturation protease n=1 Tax=Candidatus Hecatella orcuttiae TaxID=1935119 RepID=UPI002867EDC8|nr:hydrogenase maturation protease [Candidatus Hecatella orcuttiae]
MKIKLKTLILGVGNEILGDDGIGIQVARDLKKRLRRRTDIDVKEASAGGLRLIEEMLDYDKVIVVDAIATGKTEVGRIFRLSPSEFDSTRHLSSSHDLNFATALRLGENYAPNRMPKEIVVYAIEIKDFSVFTKRITAKVREAGLRVVDAILKELES